MLSMDMKEALKNAPGKAELRREKLVARKQLTEKYREVANFAICQYVRIFLRELHPSVVMAYLSDGTEPDIRPILQEHLDAGGTLCLPKFVSAERYRVVTVKTLNFSTSKWGIPEPDDDASDADNELMSSALWLIPGVAFDANLMRLGRGRGIYDRLLSGGCGCAAGIFFDCQSCEIIPAESHDRPMDAVVTETGIFTKVNISTYMGLSKKMTDPKTVRS